jgi:alginate production protein
MWIASEDVGGSDVSIDAGRLDFEDDRRWWWDDELDAVRLAWEPAEGVELGLALAQELLPERSDRDYIEPEQEDVLRVLGFATWAWRTDQAFELFASYQNDHSPSQLGETQHEEREDDTDAELSWLGARATGVRDLGERGLLGYWLDTGFVNGNERELLDRGEVIDGMAPDERIAHHDISGWAFDVGASWILPFAYDPRLFAGYAHGSREYRQTDLQANEAGFGGVERFPSYGQLLDPELSNLSVVTAGVGMSLLRSSSLDLVYHFYQRDDPEQELRDEDLDATLDERHHGLGHGVDLVLALEEWERLEFTFALAALRSGDAFVDRPGTWSYGGYAAVRYAF